MVPKGRKSPIASEGVGAGPKVFQTIFGSLERSQRTPALLTGLLGRHMYAQGCCGISHYRRGRQALPRLHDIPRLLLTLPTAP